MGTTLQGQQINQTYSGLLKSTDSLDITSEKLITDGLGNDLAMKLSPTTFKPVGICNFSEVSNFVAAPWALQSNFTTLETQVNTNTTDIASNTADILTISGTAESALSLGISNLSQININAGNIQNNTTGLNALTNGTNNVISFGVSGGTELVGDITISEGNNITLTQTGNNIEISASGTGGAAVDDVNGLTGSIDLVSTDADFLTITNNGQNIEFDVLAQRTILEDVKNTTGSAIFKGQLLHIVGSTGNEAEVILADSSLGLAAHLVANETINTGQNGKAVAVGFINNVSVADTTNFQPGTEVYLGSGGSFTHIKPTGTNIVQYLGVVVKASSISGSGTISGIIQNLGIENQLPNLQQNYIWVGDSNGVPQEVPYTSGGVSSLEGLTGALSFSGVNINITDNGTDTITFSADTGGGGVVQSYTNGVDNRVITSTGVDGINGETNLLFDGGNLDIKGQGITNGVRINGGNIGGTLASIGTIDGTGQINIKNDIVLQGQSKIAFDLDPTNTYIAADTLDPENLVFHADAKLQFYPDDAFEVFAVGMGVNRVFTIGSGSLSARVGIGSSAETGERELYVKGGIVYGEDFYDYENTQSALTFKGETINLGTPVSTSPGKIYVFQGGTWTLAGNNLNSSSALLGMAVGTSSNKGMLINGWYDFGVVNINNGQLYMDSNGDFTDTQPSTSGDYVRIIGHGTGGSLVRFNPSNDFYEVE